MNLEKRANKMKCKSDITRVYVMAFTVNGTNLAERIGDVFSEWEDIDAKFFVTKRLAGGSPSSLGEFTSKAFAEADHIIYIGAAGIAVRAIAPHLKSKDIDPGVIVIDEHAKHVIPILSGHIGGSNELAIKLARSLSSEPVITTATDINNVISIDSWAVSNSMKIDSIKNIRHISSAVLENKKIKIYIDCRGNFANLKAQELVKLHSSFEIVDRLTSDVTEGECSQTGLPLHPLVVITDSNSVIEHIREKFPEALVLIPCVTFIGMGCRKDIDELFVDELFEQAMAQLDLDVRAVESINTADLKKDEKALLALVKKHNLGFKTFSAQELIEAENYTDSEMSHSELVSKTVGAGNVCERAAVMGAFGSRAHAELKGQMLISDRNSEQNIEPINIIMEKTKRNGVTIAVSCI